VGMMFLRMQSGDPKRCRTSPVPGDHVWDDYGGQYAVLAKGQICTREAYLSTRAWEPAVARPTAGISLVIRLRCSPAECRRSARTHAHEIFCRNHTVSTDIFAFGCVIRLVLHRGSSGQCHSYRSNCPAARPNRTSTRTCHESLRRRVRLVPQRSPFQTLPRTSK